MENFLGSISKFLQPTEDTWSTSDSECIRSYPVICVTRLGQYTELSGNLRHSDSDSIRSNPVKYLGQYTKLSGKLRHSDSEKYTGLSGNLRHIDSNNMRHCSGSIRSYPVICVQRKMSSNR